MEDEMFDLWKLQDFAPGEGVLRGAAREDFDDSHWIDAHVPGDVHTALLAAGCIEDPFYDRNEPKCAWVQDREWWYRLRFDGPATSLQPDERVQLVFHGLDTFATIYLNGQELGTSSNMFHAYTFDVSKLLRFGKPNTLAVRFDRHLDHVRNTDTRSWNNTNLPRVGMRKAQFGYGWDWGPVLPTIGLWRPVELRRQRVAAITGVHFYTLELDQEADQALVGVRVEAERFIADEPVTADITLTPPHQTGQAGPVKSTIALSGDGAALCGTAYLTVENPALWWTNDLGEQPLYDLGVTFVHGNVPVAEQHTPVGIRTLTLDQSPDPDERGTRFFRFVLNGVPIFAKGADWIPCYSFVGAITPDHYRKLLAAAKEANMNMLRVWGGGIYEHDIFYDLCDRLGLLIWQDFMFACAWYPESDPAFVAEVEAEARYQVRRLRSHPCMALWCGNNENQWIHDRIYWNRPDFKVPGSLYYDKILPTIVAELDGHVPYWPGSPYGGNDYNSPEDGDAHNWHVWHGNLPRRFGEEPQRINTPENVSYVNYASDLSRFVSEFGMHASPVYETLRRNIPADQLYHHSPSMDHHNKDNPKNKGDNLMLTVTGLPKTLNEYIDFSMIAQAEGLKFGIEHFRRRKPHCSGSLFWQLNDCWPVLSWSVIDYYGFGKAGYYYARRAYEPLLASFKALPDGDVELWMTNDLLEDVSDTLTVRLGTFSGDTIWQEDHDVTVAANSSQVVHRWPTEKIASAPDRYLSVHSKRLATRWNRHFFVPIKDLKRATPRLDTRFESVDEHTLRVQITTPAYAYFVHLIVPHEATWFSNNYFDLEPGSQTTVTIHNAEIALTPEMVEVTCR
jgi:beta-mannosidase